MIHIFKGKIGSRYPNTYANSKRNVSINVSRAVPEEYAGYHRHTLVSMYSREDISRKNDPFVMLSHKEFKGEGHKVMLRYPEHDLYERLIYGGLGSERSITLETVRDTTENIINVIKRLDMTDVVVNIPNIAGIDRCSAIRTFFEKALVANYQFDKYKSKKRQYLHEYTLLDADMDAKVLETISEVEKYADATILTRELSSILPEDSDPHTVQERIMSVVNQNPDLFESEIIIDEYLKEVMEMTYDAGYGDPIEPRVLVVKYKGNSKHEKMDIAFISAGMSCRNESQNILNDMAYFLLVLIIVVHLLWWVLCQHFQN